jgi:hypothetical protein
MQTPIMTTEDPSFITSSVLGSSCNESCMDVVVVVVVVTKCVFEVDHIKKRESLS